MNYNTLRNKPTINYRELIGDSTVSEVGGITEEEFNTLMNTDLASYYTKAQIDELFARSFVYREKSGSIVTFDCPSSITTGISSVTSEIVAVQSGTGDPSPTNVRPISGWSAVNVVVSSTTSAEDGTTYNIQFKDGDNPLTVYGGQLDVVSGELVVDRVMKEVTSISSMGQSSGGLWYCTLRISDKPSIDGSNLISDYFKMGYGTVGCCYITGDGSILVFVLPQDITTSADANSWCETNKPHFVYELATPITIQLTPTMVKSLLGTNNLWADSGDVTVTALDKIIQG